MLITQWVHNVFLVILVFPLFTTDKPYITQFASDSLSVENNSTVWCEVDGNPVSVITMFNISDESSHLSMVPGGTNVKHKIIGSTLNCRAKVELKCLAENGIGVAEENIAMTVGCKLFSYYVSYKNNLWKQQ